MKVIIAGGRDLYLTPGEIALLLEEHYPDISEVVSGAARGMDSCGEVFANEVGIPTRRFPADWEANGKAAGPIRNHQMAIYADAAIVIWDGKSKGSGNMIQNMKKLDKLVVSIIKE